MFYVPLIFGEYIPEHNPSDTPISFYYSLLISTDEFRILNPNAFLFITFSLLIVLGLIMFQSIVLNLVDIRTNENRHVSNEKLTSNLLTLKSNTGSVQLLLLLESIVICILLFAFFSIFIFYEALIDHRPHPTGFLSRFRLGWGVIFHFIILLFQGLKWLKIFKRLM